MAGKLSLSKKQPGVIVLHTRKGDQIRLMTSDMRGDENPAYIKLWDKGFLAGAFIRSIVNTDYILSKDGPYIPVAYIQLILVDSSIPIFDSIYHFIIDRIGVNHFLSTIIAAINDLDAF